MKKWSEEDLVKHVSNSSSMRAVIFKLGLIPAGGNYSVIKEHIKKLNLNTDHFLGKGNNQGATHKGGNRPVEIEKILVKGSVVQSYKLKKRLFKLGLKKECCEKCSWAEISIDGRVPLELDHINGDRYDNRLLNLRVLCPNCHSLQPTHRGKNKKK